MDKATTMRLVLMTVGTTTMLILVVVLGIILFNSRNALDRAILPIENEGMIKETTTKLIDDTSTLPSKPGFWVKDAKATISSSVTQVTWAIRVQKESS